jgi:hypothetical protein
VKDHSPDIETQVGRQVLKPVEGCLVRHWGCSDDEIFSSTERLDRGEKV